MDSRKRREIEGLFYAVMDRLDPTGFNTKRYREMFAAMSEAQFESYAKRMATEDGFAPYLSVMPWENEPRLSDIKSAADLLGIPLDEHVYYRHQTDAEGNPVRTAKPVPVGYLSLRRLQQVLKKKNAGTIDTKQRNPITGQVSGDSKVARDSDSENYALTAVGADNILRELHGPRADNVSAMQDMHRSISLAGYTRLADMTQDVGKKSTLNAFDVYLLGAGLKSDLLTSGDKLYWSERKEFETK